MSALQVVCVTNVDDAKGESAANKLEEVCLMALAEVRKACNSVKANLVVIALESLDFHGSSNFFPFYEADVTIVDMSSRQYQASLIYHIGIRESVGKPHTIITLFDSNPEFTLSVRLSCCSADFLSYTTDRSGKSIVAQFTGPSLNDSEERSGSLSQFIRRILKAVACKSKVHAKEKFLGELKRMRDTLKGDELRSVLLQMKSRLYDPDLYSTEVILNMLLLYRDVQDYSSMVELVEDLESVPPNTITHTVTIQHLYAFALNRRNMPGDREESLKRILKAIEMSGSAIPDLMCLCGRIYKDLYVESQMQDADSLKKAIKWYKEGYEAQVNIYAGINLATLLVISGQTFHHSPELQKITRTLTSLIGRKGSLKTLTDYWDVATFFEVCVLRHDYCRATQAAECMYKLDPPVWYFKSTLGNIQLIHSSTPPDGEKEPRPDVEVFDFWLDMFAEAIKESTTDIRFPVLILEASQLLQPSYLQVNEEGYEPSVRLWHVGEREKGGREVMSEWCFPAERIKSISKCHHNHKALYFYVFDNADDFHIFLPTPYLRDKVHDSIVAMVASKGDDGVMMMDVDVRLPVISYEYEYDERGEKLLLGRGRFGAVYSGFNSETQVKIAIKEIPEMDDDESQALHEEVRNHCRLQHHNIVHYLGSVSEDGLLKIFMERIPGGSLSSLLREKWGPLKANETTIVIYTLQIVKGLNFLHDNRLVHRDLKGSNVLVNTYSGVLKITDFSISRRLRTINPPQPPTQFPQTPTPHEDGGDDDLAINECFPAPEVQQRGVRGYGFAADVWSVGCTVVEMATGESPRRSTTYPSSHTPLIPPELSHSAADFLQCCFTLDAKSRPSTSQLLHHSFIHDSHKKKSPQVNHNNKLLDINRSLSMPASALLPPMSATTPTHGPPRRKTQGVSLGQVEETPPPYLPYTHEPFTTPFKYHDMQPPLSPHPHNLVESKTRRIRPRSDIFPIKEFPSLFSIDSVFSSDTPLGTPDCMLADAESFYTLQKDSERKSTLVKVLTDDQDKICDKWLKQLQLKPNRPTSHKINKEHLLKLLAGMREFINHHDLSQLKLVIDNLNEEMQFEKKGKTEMLLAAYIFQEIVSEILRAHNIEPHWMFALDIIISNTMHQVISIISPELGESFREEEDSAIHLDDDVTSHDSFSEKVVRKLKPRMRQQSLLEENNSLLRSLIKSQLLSKDLMMKGIASTNMHSQFVRELMTCNTQEQQLLQTTSAMPHAPPSRGGEVADWLRECHVSLDTTNKILKEQFELRHLVELVHRSDLELLHIKCGDLCRIWQAIEVERGSGGAMEE